MKKYSEHERRRQLHKLATKLLGMCDQSDEGEDMGWGICDTKRPFGFSGYYAVYGDILGFAGIEPENASDGFSDEELDYGSELYNDVAGYILERWQEITEP